jgi:hypothetical protein
MQLVMDSSLFGKPAAEQYQAFRRHHLLRETEWPACRRAAEQGDELSSF